MNTNVKTAVDELEELADTIDAKGGAVTPGDIARLRTKMAEVSRLKDAEKVSEAKTFLSQLSGTAETNGGTTVLGGRSDSKAAWADEVASRLTKTIGSFGLKALSTGGIDVPSSVASVVGKPVEPTRVLDLLGRQPLEGNEFEYLRQTVRTNNAAVVADGATKPTSVYTFEDVMDRARVVAHLSEPLPLRFLADHAEVKNLLQTQMAEDVMVALEEDVLTGDGTGEHFTGLANVVGVQAQAYSSSVLTTLRKARTKLLTSAEEPTAFVMNHQDFEAVDMTLDNNDNFLAGVAEKVFGGLPVVGTSVIPSGTAYLGNWGMARLYVREAARLDVDASGELFEQNEVRLRLEGRFGWACLRPSAFVEIDLTA